MSYKNQNMNYSLEPNKFYLDRNEDIQSQEITIKNTGIETWNNVILKCIDLINIMCILHSVYVINKYNYESRP